jgi:hypothetical protein
VYGFTNNQVLSTTRKNNAMYEPQSTEPTDEFTLLKVIADIRQKTGVGDKVMLADLAGVLGYLMHQGCDDCQEERNKQLERLKQMKGV